MTTNLKLIIPICLCVLCVLLSTDCYAQGKITRHETKSKVTFHRLDQLTNEAAYRVEGSNGKYGVADRNNTLILPCKFTWVDPFRENRSHVQLTKNGKYAIINEKGDFISDYIYDGVSAAYEGRIKVSKYDSSGKYKSGFIDLDGNIIIPIIYDTPSDAKWIYVDGKVKLSLDGEDIWFDRDGKIISQ